MVNGRASPDGYQHILVAAIVKQVDSGACVMFCFLGGMMDPLLVCCSKTKESFIYLFANSLTKKKDTGRQGGREEGKGSEYLQASYH